MTPTISNISFQSLSSGNIGWASLSPKSKLLLNLKLPEYPSDAIRGAFHTTKFCYMHKIISKHNVKPKTYWVYVKHVWISCFALGPIPKRPHYVLANFQNLKKKYSKYFWYQTFWARHIQPRITAVTAKTTIETSFLPVYQKQCNRHPHDSNMLPHGVRNPVKGGRAAQWEVLLGPLISWINKPSFHAYWIFPPSLWLLSEIFQRNRA